MLDTEKIEQKNLKAKETEKNHQMTMEIEGTLTG